MNVNQIWIKNRQIKMICRFTYKVPRHAVCCIVLNLPKQDGAARSIISALAEAYRIITISSSSFL